MPKPQSLALILCAYTACFAAAFAYLYLDSLSSLRTDNLLLNTLIADLVATTVIFIFSRSFKNSSFYDAYWSVFPPIAFHYWLIELNLTWDLGLVLIALVIWYWAIRLTWNWTKHWEGLSHEDWRYVNLKTDNPKFAFLIDYFGIHVFPTFQVFLGLVPVYYFVVANTDPSVILMILAFVVGIAAASLQLIADRQLHSFIETRKPGQIIHHGLWKYSRHPNYLGELMFWLSLALFGLSVSPQDFLWMTAGFFAMLAMFVFASIPMMEKRSLERRPDYQKIIDSTSMLLLLPPKKP